MVALWQKDHSSAMKYRQTMRSTGCIYSNDYSKMQKMFIRRYRKNISKIETFHSRLRAIDPDGLHQETKEFQRKKEMEESNRRIGSRTNKNNVVLRKKRARCKLTKMRNNEEVRSRTRRKRKKKERKQWKEETNKQQTRKEGTVLTRKELQ